MSLGISGAFNRIVLSSTLIIAPINGVEEQNVSKIITIHSLSEVQISQPEKTLFLYDLDDTIFDFPYMVGSKGWRSYIREATQKIDDSQNWHDILSYYLTKNYAVKTVEPMTSIWIKDLQAKGYVVCGFTSRERKLWYDLPQVGVDAMTTQQLNSVDVDFHNNALETTYPDFAQHPEYFSGIFFCNIEPKGNFLTDFLKNASIKPSKVVFIDDKFSQIESVANALGALGIPNESYYYTATNAKTDNFNPLIANIQLYYFLKSGEILSDDAAALRAKENPFHTADEYLQDILELAKNLLLCIKGQ